MGSAGVIERSLVAMRNNSPQDFRALMRDPDWMRVGLTAFRIRLENAERDAVRLWFEAQGWVGGQETVLILAFLAAHGVSSTEQAERYLTLAKSVEGANPSDAYRLAKQLVRERVLSDPQERRLAMQEIFGMFAVEGGAAAPAEAKPESVATNGNGKRNGNGRH